MKQNFPYLKKIFLIIITLRLIIERHNPKLLGENLNFLSLSLKIINLIMSLKCKHSPRCLTEPTLAPLVEPETTNKKGKRPF